MMFWEYLFFALGLFVVAFWLWIIICEIPNAVQYPDNYTDDPREEELLNSIKKDKTEDAA